MDVYSQSWNHRVLCEVAFQLGPRGLLGDLRSGPLSLEEIVMMMLLRHWIARRTVAKFVNVSRQCAYDLVKACILGLENWVPVLRSRTIRARPHTHRVNHVRVCSLRRTTSLEGAEVLSTWSQL